MLFCDRSLQVAEFLLAMFQKRQIVKHYWCLTKSVPNPQQGLLLLTAVNMFIVSYYLIVCDTLIADIQIKCYVICMLYKGCSKLRIWCKIVGSQLLWPTFHSIWFMNNNACWSRLFQEAWIDNCTLLVAFVCYMLHILDDCVCWNIMQVSLTYPLQKVWLATDIGSVVEMSFAVDCLHCISIWLNM